MKTLDLWLRIGGLLAAIWAFHWWFDRPKVPAILDIQSVPGDIICVPGTHEVDLGDGGWLQIDDAP